MADARARFDLAVQLVLAANVNHMDRAAGIGDAAMRPRADRAKRIIEKKHNRAFVRMLEKEVERVEIRHRLELGLGNRVYYTRLRAAGS